MMEKPWRAEVLMLGPEPLGEAGRDLQTPCREHGLPAANLGPREHGSFMVLQGPD